MTEDEAKARGPYGDLVAQRLRFWAQGVAARFGGPVLLIGSACYSPTPADIDIRVVIPDAEFAGRYGVDTRDWATADRGQVWMDDMARLNRAVAAGYRLNADVQVWPRDAWTEPGHYRPIVLADLSPGWFIGPWVKP